MYKTNRYSNLKTAKAALLKSILSIKLCPNTTLTAESSIGASLTEPEGGLTDPDGGRVEPDAGLDSDPSKC